MDKGTKIDRFPFMAETFLVDGKGRLRTTTLCNYMLSCAGRHAEARGFGATDSLGWVLARMALHIDKIPMWRDRFYIETWVRNLYHGFTDRCIRVVDEEGNQLIVYHARPFSHFDKECGSYCDEPLYDPCRHARVKIVKFDKNNTPILK